MAIHVVYIELQYFFEIFFSLFDISQSQFSQSYYIIAMYSVTYIQIVFPNGYIRQGHRKIIDTAGVEEMFFTMGDQFVKSTLGFIFEPQCLIRQSLRVNLMWLLIIVEKSLLRFVRAYGCQMKKIYRLFLIT